MSNNKQSSVEWLDNELASLHFDYLTGRIDNKDFNERHKAIIKQAKAMHKEEIIKAVKYGYNKEYFTPNFRDQEELFEQYYERNP